MTKKEERIWQAIQTANTYNWDEKDLENEGYSHEEISEILRCLRDNRSGLWKSGWWRAI